MLTLVAREDGIVVSVELTKTTERAARRAATAKAEKAYKEAKAEHCRKSALMGSKRYNGEYTPYKRERKCSLIDEVYAEIEDMELLKIEEERETIVGKWDAINKLNKEISSMRNKLTCLEVEKAASAEKLCNNTITTAEGLSAYEAMMSKHYEILDIKDTISNIENEIHSIMDSLEF